MKSSLNKVNKSKVVTGRLTLDQYDEWKASKLPLFVWVLLHPEYFKDSDTESK